MDTNISSNDGRLEKVSFIVLLITIILTPLAFLPTVFAPIELVKTAVIATGILLSSILYFITLLRSKNISIIKHPLIITSVGIVLSLFISTLVSTSISKSFFGRGFETDTASFILVLFLTSLITVLLTNRDKKRINYIFGSIIISFGIVAVFHIVRLFTGEDYITLNIFKTATSTMLGKWNDLALFSGVVGVFSYFTLRFTEQTKLYKAIYAVLSIISLVFIILVNSSIVWCILSIVFALILCTEHYISPIESKGIKGFLKKINIITLIILLITIVGFWKGNTIMSPVVNKLNINQAEVILPWQFTLDVAADTIKESPLFGAGPNRFVNQYLKYKPQAINQTAFWNVEFNDGFGYIPNFVVTQGIVGIILWILFIVIFAYSGYKALRRKYDDHTRFLVFSTFFTSLFLWIACIVYIPSHSMLFLTFLLSGVFFTCMVNDGQHKRIEINKFAPLLVLIITIAGILWLTVYVKKVISLGYFQSGVRALNIPNNEGLVRAEDRFRKALSLDKEDTYYQALTEVNILKTTILGQQIQAEIQKTGNRPNEESVKKLSALVEEASQFAKNAISLDPTNYYNYLSDGRISEMALSLQVPGAYENTKNAYINTLKYNPYNPSTYLTLARIEASQNKLAEAQKNIGLALQLKQNYLDAIFLLSQIQVNQGQIKDAIISVQVASQINPTNPTIFFQLGLLHYNDKNYQGAIEAFNKAISLDDKYANSIYFLGLSYARLNMISEATAQFENLEISNPDNQEVKLILSNLRAGKSIFADAKPPIDSKPESRKTLPIKEKAQATKPTVTQ